MVNSFKCHIILLLALTIIDMTLQFLDIHLQLTVGALSDIFKAIHQMQVELAPVDFFGTIAHVTIRPFLPVFAGDSGVLSALGDEGALLVGLLFFDDLLDFGLGVFQLTFQL